MKKRILSMVLAVMLIVTILPTTALAVEDNTFSDIADHWAESVILEKQAKGFVKGMPDGTFKPDDSLTNGQLITLVNRFFGLTMSEDNQFADVEGDEWYVGEADKAEYYGYVDSAALNGDIPILRLDMLWILDSLMHVEETNVAAPFDDLDGLSSEELDLVNRFYARGYLEGDGQGNATLGEGLTRAQVLTFFDNTLGYIVLTQEDVANIPENGKVTVIGQNIVIEAKTIEELYIAPGVHGDVTVRNTVLTKATLGGEGTDGAVIIDNVTVSGELIVQDGAVDLTGTTIKKVTIRGESKINTDENTAITSLEVNAPVTITGGGKITEAEITVDGAAIEKKPTYYVVKHGVTADVGGDKTTYINDRPRPSGGSSGGGTAAPISPAQVTQVKLVDGTWVADASGTHTGIWTIEDLVLVGSDAINDDSSVWELDDDYVLMADLDFTSDASYRDAIGLDTNDVDGDSDVTETLKNALITGSGFAPIGNYMYSFEGLFDGNNNIIANLFINRSADDNIGLFGYTYGAVIKNIGLMGVNVTGNESVGGLVGHAYYYDSITNSYVTGVVTGVASEDCYVGGLAGFVNESDISTSYAACDVISAGNLVGGLIGYSQYSTVDSCYATGSVSGANNVGGLVGYPCDGNTIAACYATGDVSGNDQVGGLVGYAAESQITNCYATGDVSGNDRVGGLVGYTFYYGDITNSIAFNTSVSGSSNVNRILGENNAGSPATLTGNYANMAMTVNGSIATGGTSDLNGADMTAGAFKTSTSAPYSSGWDFTNTWEIKTGADRPTLRVVIVTSIAVKTAPAKVTYDEGDSLDLAGLVITLTNNDGSTEDVGAADFSSKGITSDPVDGATLGLADTVITISLGGISTTQDITVNASSLPPQSTQVSFNNGEWVVDASGTATGIWAIEDLALVGSETTTDTGVWELSDSYVLMADLDFDADDSYRDAAAHKSTYTTGSGFAPIGDSTNNFAGSFDGNGNTIANLYINRDASDYIGLFGYANGATFKHIGLMGVNITGANFAGGLVGQAIGGTITNSYATGSVTGYDHVGGLVGTVRCSITDCYATGSVSGAGNNIGGLVGVAGSNITNAYATGDVSGAGDIGGLIGHAYVGNIESCIAFNTSVNGSAAAKRVLGHNASNHAILTGNYANEAMRANGNIVSGGTHDSLNGANMTSAEFGDSASTPYSGNWDFTNIWEFKTGADRPTLRGVGNDSGVFVIVASIAVKTAPTKVTYDEGDSLDLAGLVITLTNNDSSTEDVGTADFSSKGITSDPVDGATLGLADTVITISLGGISTTQDITTLPAQGTQVSYNSSSGMWEIDASGSATGIWAGEDLALVGSETTSGSGVWELSDSYVLMTNLDFHVDASYRDAAANKSTYTDTAGSGFTPIGDDPNLFTGLFDGNGNTIANLYINRGASDYIGLFGYTNGATLKNIGLTGVNVTGYDHVGGLVGYAETNSTIANNYATGDISGHCNIGGLVGTVRCSITDCYATGSVSGAGNNIGGLVGLLYGNIKNAYATGVITGTDNVGGLVGYAYGDSIINSIAFNLDISGGSDVNRILGEIAVSHDTTLTGNYANGAMAVFGSAGGASDLNGANMTAEQFKTSSSAPYSSGWDFTNTWEFKPDADRPTLRGVGNDNGAMS